MIWVHGLGEILGVAARTGFGGVVVISKMASRTIICDRRMRLIQRIIRVVDVESGWFPARFNGVTTLTVGRKTQRAVVRIGRLIERPSMTTHTFRGRIRKIAPRMALRTILYIVSFGQRKKIVIHRIGIPIKGVNTMAIDTIGGKSRIGVIWIRASLESCEVTTNAIIPNSVKLKSRF